MLWRRATSSLRALLLLLIAAAALPLLAFGLASVYWDYQRSRADAERQAVQIARGLAQAVESELDAAIAASRTLALAPDLITGNLGRFRETALAYEAEQPDRSGVSVENRDGLVLMATTAPWGETFMRRDPEISARVFDRKQPIVTTALPGAAGRRLAVLIDIPVLRDLFMRFLSRSFAPASECSG